MPKKPTAKEGKAKSKGGRPRKDPGALTVAEVDAIVAGVEAQVAEAQVEALPAGAALVDPAWRNLLGVTIDAAVKFLGMAKRVLILKDVEGTEIFAACFRLGEALRDDLTIFLGQKAETTFVTKTEENDLTQKPQKD